MRPTRFLELDKTLTASAVEQNQRLFWTTKKDEILIERVKAGVLSTDIAAELATSDESIRRRLQRIRCANGYAPGDPFWIVDGRAELIKRYWDDPSKTCKMIADMIGNGCTKNMVISKGHLLGLGNRPAIRMDSGSKKMTGTAQKTGCPAKIIHFPKPYIGRRNGLQLPDLTESMCHWPIGDPRGEDFHYCGRNRSFGVPYCEHHAAVAYNPERSRRRA